MPKAAQTPTPSDLLFEILRLRRALDAEPPVTDEGLDLRGDLRAKLERQALRLPVETPAGAAAAIRAVMADLPEEPGLYGRFRDHLLGAAVAYVERLALGSA